MYYGTQLVEKLGLMEDHNERNRRFECGIEEEDVRKGPWTEEEDKLLADCVKLRGHRRWNDVARYSGLKRTGKSCRLRWLNYLRPDVRHGNLTLQEQYTILHFHSLWGSRWSKIAQQLPGRTDNEIKNYYRTRVKKQAKQLNCEVDSDVFKETMRSVLMPRLLEQIHVQSSAATQQYLECQHSPLELDDDLDRTSSDVFGTLSSWPDDLFSDVSVPINGLGQIDDLVPGSGLDPAISGAKDINDDYSLWDDDNPWLI